MPQMAPYNWFMLFLLFNIILIFIISFNHFLLFKSSPKTIKNNPINLKYDWLW